MINKLWTAQFIRISIANFLLFLSIYMLFLVLPTEMAERLSLDHFQMGGIFLHFILGAFIIGPFYAYIIDAYNRKSVYVFATLLTALGSIGYAIVDNYNTLMLLCTLQGAAFGVATSTGITLAIDLTNTALRNSGNRGFTWIARLGMIIGLSAGLFLFRSAHFMSMIYVSAGLGILSGLLLMRAYVPFRAPIATSLLSCDRFLLVRGWLPGLNLLLVTYVFGLIIGLSQDFVTFNISEFHLYIPFLSISVVGYLLSVVVSRINILNGKLLYLVLIGILLIILSVFLIECNQFIYSALLLGLGLGILAPEFLLIFIKLSKHCQRSTANTMHLLCCEIGICLGLFSAIFINRMDTILLISKITGVIAFVVFAVFTFPYLLKRKIR